MSHRIEMSWSGWGDPDQRTHLSPAMLELARGALGIEQPGDAVPALGQLTLAPPAVPAKVLRELAAAVGEVNLLTDAAARVRHLRGKSTPDLLRLRSGDTGDAPDAVLLPGDHAEVLAALEICARNGVGVIPFGGGTSVVGGLTPNRAGRAGALALDLRRLNTLLDLDEISRVATLGPGLRGPEAEALLGERGYTLGHFPQSYEYATVGGFAAARSSGQASAGYGRFDERVVSLTLATPQGTVHCGQAPRASTGPDLRQLFLGSEGAFGVITAVGVEVTPAPEARIYDGWRFPSLKAGCQALRALAQDGPRPTVLRLSDEVETALNLASPDAIGAGAGAGGCLAIVGYEGRSDEVERRRSLAEEVLRRFRAAPEPDAGTAWAAGRYSAPYLRDALLDAGALVETLETAGFWSRVPDLYADVREALTRSLTFDGRPPLILTHVSHVYASGASLYFTVACAQGDDPLARWAEAKAAACEAILAAGGAISHHHGVGTDHRPWFEQQTGPLGIEALRAVKRTFDPAGIMNPGVLLR